LKKSAAKDARRFDKSLIEAGQQCVKRLYLDFRQQESTKLSERRRVLSQTGQHLVELAQSAFPKGVAVVGNTFADAVARTQELLGTDQPILFGAAFRTDDLEIRTDILLRQKDGAVDVYEVKTGTKVKPRYVNDLAVQALAIEQNGLKLRAAYILHVNARYVHKAGEQMEALRLLKSAEVTERVRRQLPRTARFVKMLRTHVDDEGVLALPTGTWCTVPFPCPWLERCAAEGPPHPLRELPELTRQQESRLHQDAIEDLQKLDPKYPGLTFKQRRVVQCVQQQVPLIEPFVREELRQVEYPLHFLAVLAVVEALPRFDGQRPWRSLPCAWAAQTLHRDGRVEEAVFVAADRDDPRPGIARSLGKQLENGGMIVCWNAEELDGIRAMVEDLPAEKPLVRSILGCPHLEMKKLFDAGLFHPGLHGRRDLQTSAAVLLGDTSCRELAIADDEQVYAALQKAWTPRVRAATKEKIAADLRACVRWRSKVLFALYRQQAHLEIPDPTQSAVDLPTASAAQKPLPDQPDAPPKQLPRDEQRGRQ
jgi:hypothetical protein